MLLHMKYLRIMLSASLIACSGVRVSATTRSITNEITIQGPDASQLESGFAFNWPDASRTNIEDGEYLAPLREGDRAPYAGLLLSPPAVARVVSSAANDRAICRTIAETQYDLLLATANRELALAASRHQQASETANVRIERLNLELDLASRNSGSGFNIWHYVAFGSSLVFIGLASFAFGAIVF